LQLKKSVLSIYVKVKMARLIMFLLHHNIFLCGPLIMLDYTYRLLESLLGSLIVWLPTFFKTYSFGFRKKKTILKLGFACNMSYNTSERDNFAI